MIDYFHYSSSKQVTRRERKVLWRFEVKSNDKILEEYEEIYNVRQNSQDQMKGLLEECDFKIVEEFHDFNAEPLCADSRNPVLIVHLQS